MAVRKYIKTAEGSIPILQRYEIIDKIDQAETLRDKALISFLYLTGARIEEVVKYQKPNKPRLPGESYYKLMGEPIRKKQLEFKEDVILVQNVRSLKRRGYKPRTIPIFKAEREDKLINI